MMTRTARVAVNTLANYVRFGISMAVWFFLTPVMIHSLGARDYGLWQLVFSVLGFFSLLDFGIGTGVVKYVARASGSGDVAQRNRMVSTYLAAYVFIAVLATLAVFALSLVFNQIFRIPPGQQEAALAVLWLVGLRAVILAFPLGLFRGVLYGEQRIVHINVIQTVTIVLYGLWTWWALKQGLGVVAVAWISLLTMLLEHGAYVLLAFRSTSDLRLSPRLAERGLMREATSLSVSQLLVGASGLVLLRTDPIVIQLFLGLAAVGVYSVALKVAENSLLLIKQFVNTLSPVVAQLHAQGDQAKLRFLLLNGTKFAMVPAAMLLATVLVVGTEGLVFWVGPEFATLGPVLVVLVLAMAFTVPQMVVFNLLTYTDKHQLPARASVAAAVTNLATTILLVRPLGLMGVALGTLTATVLVDVLWVLGQGCREYGVSYGRYVRQALVPALAPALALLVSTWILKAIRPPASLLELALYLVPGVVAYLALFWRFAVDEGERTLFRERLLRWRAQPVGDTQELAP